MTIPPLTASPLPLRIPAGPHRELLPHHKPAIIQRLVYPPHNDIPFLPSLRPLPSHITTSSSQTNNPLFSPRGIPLLLQSSTTTTTSASSPPPPSDARSAMPLHPSENQPRINTPAPTKSIEGRDNPRECTTLLLLIMMRRGIRVSIDLSRGTTVLRCVTIDHMQSILPVIIHGPKRTTLPCAWLWTGHLAVRATQIVDKQCNSVYCLCSMFRELSQMGQSKSTARALQLGDCIQNNIFSDHCYDGAHSAMRI